MRLQVTRLILFDHAKIQNQIDIYVFFLKFYLVDFILLIYPKL